MWTKENRRHYDRSRLRYETDLTDDEWAEIEPWLPPAKPGGNKRSVNLREVDRIRAVMHHFRGERDSRKSIAPSRKLWTALRALNRYLVGQSAWLVNYAARHRAGLRVGTAITEGTANFLVNRRMNKSPVYNGTLGSEFGQKFHPANESLPPTAVAA
jgi:hypothetical protein